MQNLIKFIFNAGLLSTLALYEFSYHQTNSKEKTKIPLKQENIIKLDESQPPASYKNIKIRKVVRAIEKSLNNRDISQLNQFLDAKLLVRMEKKYSNFIDEFPNARWLIASKGVLKDKRHVITLSVTAKKKRGFHLYVLESKQRLALNITEGKIGNYEIIDEYSILKTTSKPINITLEIPDTALTGSWYDLDIIIDKPLESSIIAGSLMLLEDSKRQDIFRSLQRNSRKS